jgi:hypothetical protein
MVDHSVTNCHKIVGPGQLGRMHRMPRGQQDPLYFAQKAERRARFALGYLMLLGIVLSFIVAAMLW